ALRRHRTALVLRPDEGDALAVDGYGGPPRLRPAVLPPRRDEPSAALRLPPRGGRARPRRRALDDVPPRDAAADRAEPHRRRARRLLALVGRGLHHLLHDRRAEHAAARHLPDRP